MMTRLLHATKVRPMACGRQWVSVPNLPTAISYLISASQGASILREVGKLQGVMGKNTRTTKHWDDVEYPTTNE